MSMKIACIVGARPNFMKIAPVMRAFSAYPDVEVKLIHTGQHYDAALSDVFFDELEIPRPDISLGVGSGSHGKQTADILTAIEEVLINEKESGHGFDQMVVVGDVNSTMAATLAATKLWIPVAHVEAGLRSGDRQMPEEINRLVTDAICNSLLCSEPDGVHNLLKEGKHPSIVHLVGNVMIDTLLFQLEKAKTKPILANCEFEAGRYCVVTLHRPSNVDQKESLSALVDVLVSTSQKLPIVFPVHPRTKSRLETHQLLGTLEAAPNIRLLCPLGYHDFLCLTSQAKVIVTDSGGLQEESTALGVPCLTMRENTERPITVEIGTSTLIGSDANKLNEHLNLVIDGKYKQGSCPELWDGKAAERIAEILLK